MCGLAGYQTLNNATLVVDDQAVLRSLSKRGPDAQRCVHVHNTTLYHARLSIIDLSESAHQPMWDASGRYAIIFNGEVFNYQDIRAQLDKKGIQFRTQSDTEVILQALIQWGIEAVQQFEGFFAFAFLDKLTQRLWLVRDRYGIKPLYTYATPTAFFFGSELKALLAMPVPRVLDKLSVAQYAMLNYVPPQRSILQGVRQLAPGSWVCLHEGRVAEQGLYYQLPTTVHTTVPNYADAQTRVLQLLEASVQRRLIADVPLGVYLSGGIDSSVIATLAARHTPHLHTFTLGFDNPLYDETAYARLVAKHIGAEHTVLLVKTHDILAHYHEVLDYMDEPFADSSALNFSLLCKHAKQHVTVALSGDGADELFAGYMKHQGEYRIRTRLFEGKLLSMLRPLTALLPAHRNSKLGRKLWQAKKYIQALGISASDRFLLWACVLPPADAQALLGQDAWVALRSVLTDMAVAVTEDDLNTVLHADFALTLPGDMLVKADRMSMAHSLEVRVPFLDHHLVDYVFGLPAHYKIDAQGRKRVLRDALRSVLPAALYNRPKQGFEVPLRQWLLTEMQTYVEREVVNKDFLQAQGLFHPAAVQALWDKVKQGSNGKEEHSIWALLVFQHTYNKYFAQ